MQAHGPIQKSQNNSFAPGPHDCVTSSGSISRCPFGHLLNFYTNIDISIISNNYLMVICSGDNSSSSCFTIVMNKTLKN